MSAFLDALAQRVLVFDGAFGTWVQEQDLGPDDFGGPALEGCNERLVLTRPELIKQMHAEYFEAGVDAVETATFGAFSLVLNEYDIADETYAINEAAVRLAKEVAADFSTPDRPRFVIGSIGPGTRLPSLGQIAFAELRDDYEAMVAGQLAAGVDVLLIETVQDLLQCKAAIVGARRAMATAGTDGPAHGAGHGRDHRAAARRFRDRRRAHRARSDAARRHRAQLRHRSRGDDRAPPLPRAALAHVPLVPAQRGTAVDRRRAHALRPHSRRARRRPRALRRRVRPQHRRRVLRHHSCAPACGHRSHRHAGARRAHPRARTQLLVDLQPGHVPPGARVPRHRRAHQRQRVAQVPRRDARSRLGHVRGDGARPGEGRRARARRVRRLRRSRRRRRHARDRQPVRHPGRTPPRVRLHRARRARGRAPALRRQGHPQLGQPRRGRGRGQALRPGDVVGARVRRGRHRPRHRRRGPGPHHRRQAAHLPAHLRPRHRALRDRTHRPDLRHAHVPVGLGTGRPPRRRHRDHRGDPTRQDRAPRVVDRARPLEHQLRAEAGDPPRAQQRVPARVPRGGPRRRHRARGAHHADAQDRRPRARGHSRPDLRPSARRLRPAHRAHGAVRRRRRRRGRAGGPLRLADRATARAPHHRRRPRRPRSRPRGAALVTARAVDRQRGAARGHEGRR